MGMSSSFERPAREQICVLALGARRGATSTPDELTVGNKPSCQEKLKDLTQGIVYPDTNCPEIERV